MDSKKSKLIKMHVEYQSIGSKFIDKQQFFVFISYKYHMLVRKH